MTSTPSSTAASIAAVVSSLKQPSATAPVQQAL